jgi:2-iminobutanoate/2-iminopropanoate deaminase
MKIIPIHHTPMRPEFQSPFSAAFAVEDARLVFFSGCGPVPIYHKHPHDPVEEAQWLGGDIRDQIERTFANIEAILAATGGSLKNVLKLTIFMTDVGEQNVLNEISARRFGPDNPPARTLVQIPALAHPLMKIEIEGVAAVPTR